MHGLLIGLIVMTDSNETPTGYWLEGIAVASALFIWSIFSLVGAWAT